MTEYTAFISHHWLLTTGFIVILLLLLANEIFSYLVSAPKCTPQQLVQLMNHGDANLIDIREKDQYRTAKITTSKNIPAQELKKKSYDLDKTKPLVLICDNGQQSCKQAQLLKKDGFNVHYLAGGIAAWKNENLPLTK